MELTEEQTETPETPPPTPAPHVSMLETWSQNDRMRHVPSSVWMAQKLDTDLRRKIDALWLAYSRLAVDDPKHAALEKEFRILCRSLDRVADVARRTRGPQHPPAELGGRITWGLNHAITNLSSVDSETFGRRFPFQTFERSNAEPLWAAMLMAIEHVHRLIDIVREIDRGIDERMYEGLVTLQTPLETRPMA